MRLSSPISRGSNPCGSRRCSLHLGISHPCSRRRALPRTMINCHCRQQQEASIKPEERTEHDPAGRSDHRRSPALSGVSLVLWEFPPAFQTPRALKPEACFLGLGPCPRSNLEKTARAVVAHKRCTSAYHSPLSHLLDQRSLVFTFRCRLDRWSSREFRSSQLRQRTRSERISPRTRPPLKRDRSAIQRLHGRVHVRIYRTPYREERTGSLAMP